jgi:hypothetical protein
MSTAQPIRGFDSDFTSRDLSRFLLTIGRAGKLLQEAGYNPSEVRFCALANSEVLASLNPHIPYQPCDWDLLFEKANEYILSNFKAVFYNSKASGAYTVDECFKKASIRLVYYQDIFTEFFEKKEYLTHGDFFDKYTNLPLWKSVFPDFFTSHIEQLSDPATRLDFFRLRRNINLHSSYRGAGDEHHLTICGSPFIHGTIGISNYLKKNAPEQVYCCFPIFSVKLSGPCKKAVLGYVKKQQKRVLHWKQSSPDCTLMIPLAAYEYENETGHLLTSRAKFLRAIEDEAAKAFSAFFKVYKEHCIKNAKINLNGIELSEPVKTLLFGKISANCQLLNTGYVSKVFKVLRDHAERMEEHASILLTSDDKKMREAGFCIQSLIKEIENMKDSTNNEEETSNA